MGRADLGRPGVLPVRAEVGRGRLPLAGRPQTAPARCLAGVCGRPRAGGGLAPLRRWADRGPALPRRLPRPWRAPPRPPRPRLGGTAPAPGSGGSTWAAAGVCGVTLSAPLGDDHGRRPGRRARGVSARRSGPGGRGRGGAGGRRRAWPPPRPALRLPASAGRHCDPRPSRPPGAAAAASGERGWGCAGTVDALGTLGRSVTPRWVPTLLGSCGRSRVRASFLRSWRVHLHTCGWALIVTPVTGEETEQ